MPEKDPIVQIYQEIADLTRKNCEVSCPSKRPFRCCHRLFCEIARRNAKINWGVVLPVTGNLDLPLMGPDGCVAAPHLRPTCARYTCHKVPVGVQDPDWLARYEALRMALRVLDRDGED